MSKRAASPERVAGEAKRLASGASQFPSTTTTKPDDEGMGEFEDPFGDDIEEDQVASDAEMDQDDDDVEGEIERPDDEEDDETEEAQPQAYIPSAHQQDGTEKPELEPDQGAYEMLHRLNVTWPALSFDVLQDKLGNERGAGGGGFPHTAYWVAGTQAERQEDNEVMVMKASNMHRTIKDGNDDSDNEDEEDDDDEDGLDEDAVVEYRSFAIDGGVNRVRAAPVDRATSTSYPVAIWNDTGRVQIHDIAPMLHSLEEPHQYDKKQVSTPLHTVKAHRNEGYALDWAPQPVDGNKLPLRLLSGDIDSKIFLTVQRESGWVTNERPFLSHTSSVEDLQWSPKEQTIFASCSADSSIRIWDVRTQARKALVTNDHAHDSDVNVISWNHLTDYLILSGGDDGMLKVWDLRTWGKGSGGGGGGGNGQRASPVAEFQWHTAPIDSVEWHPTEESVFAASGRDDQVTLWDLSVEADDEETGVKSNTADLIGQGGQQVPNQLLFSHYGATEIKEVHWHKQIPGMLMTTSADGYHLFKTISV